MAYTLIPITQVIDVLQAVQEGAERLLQDKGEEGMIGSVSFLDLLGNLAIDNPEHQVGSYALNRLSYWQREWESK